MIDLTRNGVEAIFGDPEQEETLRAANIESAQTLVADIDDEANATVILSAKQLGEPSFEPEASMDVNSSLTSTVPT